MAMTTRNHTLRLRAMEPEDVDMLYALENDIEACVGSDATAPYSRNTLREYINSTRNDVFAERQLRLVVDVDGHAAGCVDLFNVDAKHRHAEVAFGLLPAYRNRGVGTAALRQLLDYASDMLGLRSLMAMVVDGNVASERLLLRTGFTYVGTLKAWTSSGDVKIFALSNLSQPS